jgi:hypothetical protein
VNAVPKPFTTTEVRAVRDLTLAGVPAVNICNNLGRSAGAIRGWRRVLGLQYLDRVQVKVNSLTFSRSTFTALSDYANSRQLKISRVLTILAERTVRGGELERVMGLQPIPPNCRATVTLPRAAASVTLRQPAFSVRVTV